MSVEKVSDVLLSSDDDLIWITSDDGDDDADDKGEYDVIAAPSFHVLTVPDADQMRQDRISLVAESLAIDEDTAEGILMSSRWETTALIDSFLSAPSPSPSPAPPDPDTALVSCGTAFCGDLPRASTMALRACGHRFCLSCWRGLAASAVATGRISIYTECPGADHHHDQPIRKCHIKIPSRMFLSFLDPTAAAKYRRWLVEAFVEGSHSLAWCIRPSCDLIIACTSPNDLVQCHCKTAFCFGCRMGDHRPAPCDLVQKWVLKAQSETETDQWLRSRTKQCPQCRIRIEKNRSCNHMLCSHCSHHFCWLCMKPWSSHDVEKFGFYRCNIYEDIEEQISNDPEALGATYATRGMQKYKFYFNRYLHQIQAEEDALRLKREIEESPSPSYQGVDVDLMIRVLLYLSSARRVLAWSFCLAYYLQQGLRKRLLEHQQTVLSALADQLQALVSSPRPSDLLRLSNALHCFSSRLVRDCGDDEDELQLLSQADDQQDRWACMICTSESDDAAQYCSSCGSCRRHSEPECRVPQCANPLTPLHTLPGVARGFAFR